MYLNNSNLSDLSQFYGHVMSFPRVERCKPHVHVICCDVTPGHQLVRCPVVGGTVLQVVKTRTWGANFVLNL